MAPPKPSTAASNTYAAPPQDLQNLTNYITRALLETRGFRAQLHPNYEELLNHRIRAGTPAQGASITSITARP